MEVLENRDEWYDTYLNNWVKKFKETGEKDYSIYKRPTNKEIPPGKAIDLSQSRLLFISSSGAYLPSKDEPFPLDGDYGEYSIRTFPASVNLDELEIAHNNYDPTFVNEDRQVLLPLRHLDDMVSEGKIGELAPSVVTFMGYQPDATRVVDETIPEILKIAKAEHAQAALLVPA